MNLWSISLRNLNIRKVSSTLTTLSIAVAAGLYAAIMLMAEQTRQRFEGSISGYQAVVGPKDASQLEVVLNAILNVGDAPGLIPLGVCKDLREGRVGRRSAVRHAIPQARGDSISKFSFPVIGTIDEMFTKFERGGQLLQFDQGGPWSFTWDELWVVAEQLAAHETAKRTKAQPVPPKPSFQPPWKQAVVGSRVARTLGLTIGSEIVPVHGKYGEFDFHEHPEAACRVVGILAPTNSPIDTTVFLPLATHLLVDGHAGGLFKVEVPAGKNPDAVKEMPVRADQIGLTAVVVDPVDHMGAQFLRLEFGTRPDAQVCWPGNVIPRFLQQVGNAADALTVIAWLVLVVAAIAIAVAIYNTMNERRREIAIMRSLGARRVQISAIIVGEAAMLSFVGSVVGVIACHMACLLLQGLVEDMTGVYLQWAAFSLRELWLVLGVTLLGALAGLLPAVKGSFTQVADNLAPNY